MAWDDYDWEVPLNKDQEEWESLRGRRMAHVYDLIDFLVMLKVLGPGWDIGLGGHDMTGQYVDKYWKV
jgi:hypothetical protein